MTILACFLLICSALVLMIAFAIGPFANDPWLQTHFRFTQLPNYLQTISKITASLVIVVCSLQIIGVFS